MKDFKLPDSASRAAAGVGAPAGGAAAGAQANGTAAPAAAAAKSTTAKLIESMPAPADECAPGPHWPLPHDRSLIMCCKVARLEAETFASCQALCSAANCGRAPDAVICACICQRCIGRPAWQAIWTGECARQHAVST